MNRKIQRMFASLFATVALVAPLLVGAATFAQAETEYGIDSSDDSSSTMLALADRSKIQLDEGEEWVDGESFSQVAISTGFVVGEFVSCNNACQNLNTVNNHFGLRSCPGACWTGGHAWAFTFNWYGDKGAYAIKVGWKAVDERYPDFGSPRTTEYRDCTWKYLNLTDKKTSNHVKIKTWGIKNPQKKAEQLFWVSKGPNGIYRIWSALAGRPLGYTKDDKLNLKTLDNREEDTTQYFILPEIDEDLCVYARAFFHEYPF